MTETITTQPSSLYHRRVSLNKRPPLIRSSSPSSSIQNIQRKASINNLSNTTKNNNKPKKSVRFCDNASLENVRLFLKTQMPKACRSDPTYPKQYTFRLKKMNWPSLTTKRNAVHLEEIQLVNHQLVGTCQVANLAFEKHVLIRYSLNEWTTFKEVDATYQEPIAGSANTWDRFYFKLGDISLNTKHHETLYLVVKYTVSGREFWDNNDSKNYQLDILPQVQLYQDEFSSSSSSSEEDNDDNTFEDCVEKEEESKEQENDLLIQQFEPLSLSSTTKYPFIDPKSTTITTIEKPWSPPLSPTTPADSNPLWMPTSESRFYNSHHTSDTTIPTEYFSTHSSNSSSNMKEAKDFHHLISRSCFYNSNNNTTHPSFYHYPSSRKATPSPPTPPISSSKAIHS